MGTAAIERLAPDAVLAELAACDHAEKAASARRLELAVLWAGLHPGVAEQPYDKVVDSLIDDATGASVAAIAEFAAVHGISTNAGRQLIADAVTLHDRLPRTWAQMATLELPAWKARMLAQHAYPLGDEATAWLDSNAAMLGGKLGVRTIKRFTLMAQARFEPDTITDPDERRWVHTGTHADELDGAGWVEGRLDTPDALDLEAALRLIAADLASEGGDDLDVRRAHALGVMARRALGQPEPPADTPDATNTGSAESPSDSADPTNASQADPVFDATIDDEGNHTAPVAPALPPHRDRHENWEGARACRIQPNQPEHRGGPGRDRGNSATRHDSPTWAGRGDESTAARDNGRAQGSEPNDHRTARSPQPTGLPGAGSGSTQWGRPVLIYLHFDATQLDTCTGLGELGTTGQLVTIDQIRAWCGTAGSITIRPVIDLNKSRSTRSYQPTEAMREHLALRDRTCVFPHCTRTAHPVRRRGTGEYSHDADHIVPHESGGETSTDNLACLCRLHHLLKTHTGWRYEMLGPGEYLWKSPGGHQFLRTDNGTTMLTMPRGRERPAAA